MKLRASLSQTKYLLLPLLAACTPYTDPCRLNVENPHCVEMDRSDRVTVVDFDLDHNPPHGDHGDDNGAGAASSDAVNHDNGGSSERNDSKDSNGNNSDED